MNVPRVFTFGRLLLLAAALAGPASAAPRPNIVLCMADDLGYGDPSFNDGWIQTPGLDAIAAQGTRLTRYYAASSICSPTRASILTGRHPYRLGIPGANTGRLEEDETTLAEALASVGYRCGFFGKWHLGTFTQLRVDANRGAPGAAGVYSPPWKHGFSTVFATESRVPSFHPMRVPVNGSPEPVSDADPQFFGTRFWRQPADPAAWPTALEGEPVALGDNLSGDVSTVVMDRVIPFLQSSAASSQPFLAVVWLYAPHIPLVDPRQVAPVDSSAAYQAAVTAMDLQIARLDQELTRLGLHTNTVFWFCSDNGPEPGYAGLTGGLRGAKYSLYEGGVRVPCFLRWPAVLPAATVLPGAAHSTDIMPTLLDWLEIPSSACAKPMEGRSLRAMLTAGAPGRPEPLGFIASDPALRAWSEGEYKLMTLNGGASYQLYHLPSDPGETLDLAPVDPARLAMLRVPFLEWQASVFADTHPLPPPFGQDTDADGLPDLRETGDGIYRDSTRTGSQPVQRDSDGDGWGDRMETRAATDPNHPASHPIPTNLLTATLFPAAFAVVGSNGTAMSPAADQVRVNWPEAGDLVVRERPDGLDSERRARLFLRFDLSSLPPAARVVDARLVLWQTDKLNGNAQGSLQVGRVLQPWQPAAPLWPLFANTPVGDARLLGINNVHGVAKSSQGFYHLDVLPEAEDWFRQPSANHGLRFSQGECRGTGTAFARLDDPLTSDRDESARLELTLYLPDQDADGLDDAWEIQHFQSLGQADSGSDADRDGFADRLESVAGTLPHDPASLLQVELGSDPAGLWLRWPSQQGRRYDVLFHPALGAPATVLQADLEPTPPLNRVPALNPPGPLGFLRVAVRPAP